MDQCLLTGLAVPIIVALTLFQDPMSHAQETGPPNSVHLPPTCAWNTPDLVVQYEAALARQESRPDSRAIEQWYDVHGAYFSTLDQGCTPSARHAVNLVLELADRTRPLTMLDAGCCSGGMVQAIRARVPGWRFCGWDASAVMLEQAAKVCDEVVQVTLPGVPAPKVEFDVVTCVGTIAYGHAPPASVAALIGVTRPGGLIIFSHHVDDYEAADWGLREAHDRALNVELVRCERGPYFPPQEDNGIYFCYRKCDERPKRDTE